jgi:hypothetical protein
MKRALCICVLLVGCGEEPKTPQQGAITDVVVVLKGGSEPLPFDPRGGRLTVVTREIQGLVGHQIVLELDTALSPELKASLEETVLASFETIARELVILQKEDPDMFAAAKKIERVRCHYDAVAKESDGELEDGGRILSVTSPPDRFPLLERGILLDAVYTSHIDALDKRWGELDPSRLSPSQQGAYFTYMMTTRPGAGYLWIAARASNAQHNWDSLRVEHFKRIIRLSNAVDQESALAEKIRHFLAGEIDYPMRTPELHHDYATWLGQNISRLNDDDQLKVANAIFMRHNETVTLPSFDRFGYGMMLYDRWTQGKVHGDLEKAVVCPKTRRGEAETEIMWSCSGFFEVTLRDPRDRAQLANTIIKRNEDRRLLELTLLNIGHDDGKHAIEFTDLFQSRPALFQQAVRLLVFDNKRRDDVQSALEPAGPRWWRDLPALRGTTLLVFGEKYDHLDAYYGDNQWQRWIAEYGGAVKRDVMQSFLAEGPRAVELVPKMWLAFAKGTERDDTYARALPVLLESDRTQRTSRSTKVLSLLRIRLCNEKNSTGLTTMRSSIERWASEHSDSRAMVSNALADYTLARCKVIDHDKRDDD